MTQATHTDLFPWIVGGLVSAVTFFAIAIYSQPDVIRAPPSSQPTLLISTSAPSNPMPQTQSIVADRATPPRTRAWECVVNGQRIFTDAPCADSAVIHEIRSPNRMQPEPIRYYPTLYPSRTSQTLMESQSRFDSPRQYSNTCDELRAETDNINARMRHGYGAQEGNYWNDQLHRISSQQYDLNCVR